MKLFNNKLNCYYRANRAYTQDHIVVKKIFLGNVPNTLEPENVQAYFEIFGNVVCLKLNKKSASSKFKSGYVLFKHSKDASTVLSKDNHFLNRCRLEVRAYHSWGQPDAKEIQAIDSSADIMRLNIDCLEIIYHYLPLVDQINLALITRRCPPIYRSINFSMFSGLSVWKVRDFFMLFGADLRQVVGQGNCVQDLCEFIGEYCSNLKILRISHCVLSVRLMHKIFKKLTALEEVQLANCLLTDDCLLALINLHQLKKLDLCSNVRLTGRHMKSLSVSVELLNILYCFHVDFELIPEICKSLSNLKDLRVNVVNSQIDVFHQLVMDKSCNSLESLTISSKPSSDSQIHMEYLAMLPSIRKLLLHHGHPSSRLLKWLVKHKSEQLTHLEIDSPVSLPTKHLLLIAQLNSLRFLSLAYNNEINSHVMEKLHRLQELTEVNLQRCSCVTVKDVFALIVACPKLHVLHLEYCKLITEKLVHDIDILGKQLSDQRGRRELPIKLYIFSSKFDKLKVIYSAAVTKNIVQVINNFSSSC